MVTSASDPRSTTPPRLNYGSFFPSKRRGAAGAATPPLRPPAAVPFQWEEAPGKPKLNAPMPPATSPSSSSSSSSSDSAKLVFDDCPSPTTVLHSPYGLLPPLDVEALFDGPSVLMGGASPFSAGGRSKSCSIERSGGGDRGSRRRGRQVLFWRKVSRGESASERFSCSGAEGRRSLSSYLGEVVVEEEGGEEEGKMEMTKWRKRDGRGSSLSSATAHLLGAIYGGLKQVVVPWRRARKKVPEAQQQWLSIPPHSPEMTRDI